MFTRDKPHAGRRKRRKKPFLSLVTLTFDLWPWTSNSVRARDQTYLSVNSAQISSAVPEIQYFIHKKNIDWRRQKQNLPQFTVCGNNLIIWGNSVACKSTAFISVRHMSAIYRLLEQSLNCYVKLFRNSAYRQISFRVCVWHVLLCH